VENETTRLVHDKQIVQHLNNNGLPIPMKLFENHKMSVASDYLTDCHQALFFQQDTLVY